MNDTHEKKETNDKSEPSNNDDSKINTASFNKIQTGMSRDEVIEIFGGNKGTLSGMRKIEGKLHPLYIWMVGGDLTNCIEVVFDDDTDKVIAKENQLKNK